MYLDAAYWHKKTPEVDDDFAVTTHPLFVTSCGNCRVLTRDGPTHRPKGRSDYQLIYIASGKAVFFFNGVKTIVPAGNVVLYRPGVEQHYIYQTVDKTDGYWIHFSGSDVENILYKCGITKGMTLVHVGTSLEYKNLLQDMIQELRLCREHYEEVLTYRLHYMLFLIHRALINAQSKSKIPISEMEEAVRYFHINYNKPICIEDYAAEHHMSVSWFIRSFKEYTKTTPTQYLLSLRISNAQALLQTTDHNVTEIASMVGYDNSLYFSRLFKKLNGLSPLQYRKQNKKGEA